MNRLVAAAIVGLLLLACDVSPSVGKEPTPASTLRVEPETAVLTVGTRRTFSALSASDEPVRVRWSVLEPDGGSIDADGSYTAPASPGTFTIQATTISSPEVRATARVSVEDGEHDPISVAVEPSIAQVSVGASLRFQSIVDGARDTRVRWTVVEAEGGSIDGSGNYTAPDTPGSYTVRAVSVIETAASADARVEVVEGVAVSLSPRVASLEFGEHRHFVATTTGTANQGVVWSVEEASGGTVSKDGIYTAPTAEGTFHVVATSVADPSRSASAEVSVRAPVEVRLDPPAVVIESGENATFTATVTGSVDHRLTWSVLEPGGGSVSSTGTYTAPETEGTFHVVATSVADPRRSATAEVTVHPPVEVRVDPSEAELEFGESTRFVATIEGTDDKREAWSVAETEGGSIDASGTYRAPMTKGTFRVVATSVADPRRSATAQVTIRPPVEVGITPSDAQLEFGEQVMLVATVAGTSDQRVTWSVLEAGGGSVSVNGRYTAPSTAGAFQVVATSVADPRRSASMKVTVRAPVEVRVTPSSPKLEYGEMVDLVATVTGTGDRRVSWSVLESGGGSVDAGGRYVAPASDGTFHVVATSVSDPRRSASAEVTVRRPVAVQVGPIGALLEYGEQAKLVATVTGSSDQRVTWSVLEKGGGSIDGGGVYTAPASDGTYHVVATSVADPRRTASVAVTVRQPVAVQIDRLSAQLEYGEQQTFLATVSGTSDRRVSWSVLETGGGSIDGGGTYTAPASDGTFHVVATSVADPRRSASVEVTIRQPVAVRVAPASAELEFGDQLTLSAAVTGTNDRRVTWSVLESGGGTIDSTGLYTAPATAGTFHVVATSVADPRRSSSAEVSVVRPIEVRVEPGQVQLEFGEEATFLATVTGTSDHRVTWSVVEVAGGVVDESGTYEAPDGEGTYHVVATSVADSAKSDAATVVVAAPNPIDLGILPQDRRTTWNPGIPGGIPRNRQVFTTLSSLAADGTGDNSTAIQTAIQNAGAAYQSGGVLQEVVLPAGTFRFTKTIALNRSGVVLRGQGTATRLRYDGSPNDPAILLGRSRWTDYSAQRGPWALTENGVKGSKQITIAIVDAANIEAGDILGIDEEDDPSFVRMGDAWYGKRQPGGDTHGPPLRAAGLWRSVGTMIQVTGKRINGGSAVLTLADPLHLGFRVAQHAQIFHLSTPRKGFDEIQYSGVEDLYLTGSTIGTNNVSYCWIDGLEVDGNPGTPNVGSYANPGGITGHSIELFHAYRCEVRNSYVHHSRSITQGGGSYLIALSGYTAESLVEDNIVVFGNKLIVGNMMGGGNVIAYNYVDNARTNSSGWQEGAIDLNHLSFTHSALVEGNWASNIGADTTHGNAGWHVFHRNFATGQNSAPIHGAYPYTSGNPDASFRRAAGIDGYNRETTFIGNVLHAGTGTGVYQVDHSAGPRLSVPAVWRIGGGVDGGGDNLDDGTALSLLYRHGNWDNVTQALVWDEQNDNRTIPTSMYLQAKPAFFGDAAWPWVDPTAASESERVKTLPAKARYDELKGIR